MAKFNGARHVSRNERQRLCPLAREGLDSESDNMFVHLGMLKMVMQYFVISSVKQGVFFLSVKCCIMARLSETLVCLRVN